MKPAKAPFELPCNTEGILQADNKNKQPYTMLLEFNCKLTYKDDMTDSYYRGKDDDSFETTPVLIRHDSLVLMT